MEGDKTSETHPADLDEFSAEQYVNPYNARIRREEMELSARNSDFYGTVFEVADLKRDGFTLDIGCGYGDDVFRLADEFGHTGPLVGLEIPLVAPGMDFEDKFVGVMAKMNEKGIANINFIPGYAQELPYADNSVDNVLMLSTIYHFPDPVKALLEARRVLRPGGTLVVISNSKHNKPKHHKMLHDMGKLLGSKPPPPLSSRFNFERCEEVLPRLFNKCHSVLQTGDFIEITPDRIAVKRSSINTYRASFTPPVDSLDWAKAREAVLNAAVWTEIEEQGAFYDPLERGAVICKKPIYPRLHTLLRGAGSAADSL